MAGQGRTSDRRGVISDLMPIRDRMCAERNKDNINKLSSLNEVSLGVSSDGPES